ncbi:MAG: protein kinase [Bradymonadales bacterium]|jgi:serine/threonine protein kinase/tetratricopeptide (TPR) repeat protein
MSQPLQPPDSLPDYFEAIKHLGEGGMGVVWSVKDKRINKIGALKALRSNSTITPVNITRFEREIRNFAQLMHPYIVQVYDVGKLKDGAPYIFMEEVKGAALSPRIFRGQSLEEILLFFDRVLEALAFAHSNAIIHRDLKPDNILVTKDASGSYIPKIMDFGLALRADEKDTRITVDGMVVGTPIYMAPEQACDEHYKISPATDLYAMGCIIYEFFSGKPPFDGKTAVSVLLAQAGDEPPPFVPLEEFASSIRMANIIRRLLEKKPDKRFDTAADLRAALRRTLLIRDGLNIGLEVYSTQNSAMSDEDKTEDGVHNAPLATVTYQEVLPEVLELNYQYSVLSIRAPKFVGRRNASHILWCYLRECYLTKRAAVCLITGRPGVGKSHFVSQLSQYAYTIGGAQKLTVDCSSQEDVVLAFYNAVFAKLLLRTLNESSIPSAIAYFFRTHSSDPRATQLLDIFKRIDSEPHSITQHSLLVLFHDIVARLCVTKPLILCFDNVDNSQTQSLRQVIELLSSPPSAKLPLLIAVTNTSINDVPTDLELCLGNNSAIWLRRGIRLEPLPNADMKALIERSLSIHPKIAPYIAKISAGYPKIAVGLARQWQLAGFLEPSPQGYIGTRPITDLPIPKNVHESILSFLYYAFDDYPTDTWLPIACLAATLGDEFSYQALELAANALPSHHHTMDAALFINDALTGAVLLARPNDLYTYANPLMRDALLSSLPALKWGDLNLAAAAAKQLLPNSQEKNKEIAKHLIEARKFDEAYKVFYELAKQYLEQGFWDQSLEYLQEAKSALSQHLDVLDAKTPELCQVWLLEVEIYLQKNEIPKARERISWLKYALKFVHSPLWPAQIALLDAKTYYALKQSQEARAKVDEAEALLPADTHEDMAYKELMLQKQVLKFQLGLVEPKELIDMARGYHDALNVAKILLIVTKFTLQSGYQEQSHASLKLVCEIAEKTNAISTQAQALQLLAQIYKTPELIKGSLKEALRCFEQLADYEQVKLLHLQLADIYRKEQNTIEAQKHERWAKLL